LLYLLFDNALGEDWCRKPRGFSVCLARRVSMLDRSTQPPGILPDVPRFKAASVVYLALAGGLAARPASARLNLPQVRQLIKVSEQAATVARDYFFDVQAPSELPASLQDPVLNGLPESFRSACGGLMESWAGETARGTNYWRVRSLDRQGTRVWLAFRCGSRLQNLGQYYDERLALLRLDAATLELLPLGPDAENDSDLYHIEFARHLALEGAKGFCFRVTTDDDNPCCAGPESRSQQRLIVFADTPHGIIESLSVVTARDDSSHSDDPDIDSETTYRADVKFERDANNLVTAATATFHQKVKDISWESAKAKRHTVSEGSGALRFRWNPRTSTFQEAR
jgi:hypothetical protein